MTNSGAFHVGVLACDRYQTVAERMLSFKHCYRIRCFCFSLAARDVQQVQETTNSPLRANGLQAADYLPHVTRGGLDS